MRVFVIVCKEQARVPSTYSVHIYSSAKTCSLSDAKQEAMSYTHSCFIFVRFRLPAGLGLDLKHFEGSHLTLDMKEMFRNVLILKTNIKK